jgi:hypothetical protein
METKRGYQVRERYVVEGRQTNVTAILNFLEDNMTGMVVLIVAGIIVMFVNGMFSSIGHVHDR